MAGPGIGETLRRAREGRGLSLDEIARRTHIAARLLDSIERNALDEIPGGVYARGYLRAYATEVDLDGENLLRAHACHLEDPSDNDLLQQLRARLHTLERNRWSAVQFLLVVAGVVCLLYVLAAIQTPSTGTSRDSRCLECDNRAVKIRGVGIGEDGSLFRRDREASPTCRPGG